jgi:hypothetical protein
MLGLSGVWDSSLMRRAEMAVETLAYLPLNHLTLLTAREHFVHKDKTSWRGKDLAYICKFICTNYCTSVLHSHSLCCYMFRLTFSAILREGVIGRRCQLLRLYVVCDGWINCDCGTLYLLELGGGGSTQRKTSLIVTLFTTNPTLTGLPSNPKLQRGEWSLTNHLNHGTSWNFCFHNTQRFHGNSENSVLWVSHAANQVCQSLLFNEYIAYMLRVYRAGTAYLISNKFICHIFVAILEYIHKYAFPVITAILYISTQLPHHSPGEMGTNFLITL